jgi:acyl-coenzyme A thioesterase PaaI-like protein
MNDASPPLEAEHPESELAAEGWRPVKDHGFIGLVGPIYSRKHEDGLEFGFRAQAKHANLRNVVQGGMLMTFADRALGRNAWRPPAKNLSRRSSSTCSSSPRAISASSSR